MKRISNPLVRHSFLAIFAGAFALATLSGCTSRDSLITSANPKSGFVYKRGHVYCENLLSQFGEFPTTKIWVYTPPGYADQALGRPYPTLYMLSPFRAGEDFYFHHGIKNVADRLISEGKIEPMIIVFVNSSGNSFGGSFYTQYQTAGDYLALNSTATIPFIDYEFNTLSGEAYRGISGYEMGGYGAFRLALTSPERFGSVSAISAPLYFTHPTFGFQSLFDDAIAEWHSSLGDNSLTSRVIDSSQSKPISGFLLAAAIGFSPEDTGWTLTLNTCDPAPRKDKLDSASAIYQINDTAAVPRTRISYSQFPVPQLLEDDKIGIFLPFDSTGATYPYIWDIWRRYDIYRLVDSVNSGQPSIISNLSSKVLVMATKAAKFNHYDQDSLFVAHFNTLGSGADFRRYEAYDGFADTEGARFLYDVWPTILKFHSDKFHAVLPAELKLANYTVGY